MKSHHLREIRRHRYMIPDDLIEDFDEAVKKMKKYFLYSKLWYEELSKIDKEFGRYKEEG